MIPSGDLPFTPESFFASCDALERLAVSDPGAAIREGFALIDHADRAGDDMFRVRARRSLAQANAYAGEFDSALGNCREAVHIGTIAGLTVETARARLASLHALSNLGRFEEAIAAGLAARASLVEAGEPELIARADLNLGAVYAMSDDPIAALTCFNRSRPAFMNQIAILAQLDTNRGNALAAIDDYSGAEAAFASAVSSFELTGQHLAAAIAEGNRGYLSARRGLIREALAHFERARRMLVDSEARSHRARLIAEQADVIATMGMATEAIKSLEQAVPVLDSTAQKIEAARARVTLANAYIASGLEEQASIEIAAAMETFADAGQFIDLGRAEITAAELALHLDDLERADSLSGLAEVHLADRPADVARAAITRARVLLRLHQASPALVAIESALQIADQLELSPIAADAHLLKGRWLRDQGQPGLSEFRLAVALTEQIRGTLQAGIFRSAFQTDRIAPYQELLTEAICGSSGNAEIAFEASELVKSRGLLDLMGASLEPANEHRLDDDPRHEQIRSLRQRVNWQYSRLNERSATVQSDRTIRSLEQEIQTLETQLAAGSTSADSGLKPVELARAQATLPDGTAAISYNFLGDELSAIVLTNQSCNVHRRLASRGEIDESLRRFRLQISRAHARGRVGEMPPRLIEDARRELLTLWKLIIEPVTSGVPEATDLVVVPGGSLHGVPFAALWDGSHYLIERQSLNIVPSLSIFTRLSEQNPAAERKTTFIVGVADADAPDIRREVQELTAITMPEQVLLDSDATAEQVLVGMSRATTLHFACHGRFLKEFPEASGLKCFDRWLTLAEIGTSKLDHAHVTLSACDSGRSSVQAVEELVGLSSAFYAAGARSMIMTLWPVDDRRTVGLMSDCYAAHRDGASFAASLRQAQMHSIQAGEHPAHWAPFIFGGRV